MGISDVNAKDVIDTYFAARGSVTYGHCLYTCVVLFLLCRPVQILTCIFMYALYIYWVTLYLFIHCIFIYSRIYIIHSIFFSLYIHLFTVYAFIHNIFIQSHYLYCIFYLTSWSISFVLLSLHT